MKISKRLQAISDFVDDNSNIIDVGCDHALLDIYLFRNKKNVALIASDVKEGPLKQARANIEKYGCNIKVKQGFGISTIEEETDTVVIAGMGGDTIVDILEKDKDKLKNVNQMILSPQSEWKKVRSVVTSLGFYIDDELMIEDNNKYYLILKFVRGEKKYSEPELTYGPILLRKRDNTFIRFYQSMLKDKKEVLGKIPLYKIKERRNIRKQVLELNRLLKNK